jgi:hypothetical protein
MLKLLDVDEVCFQRSEMLILPSERFDRIKLLILLICALADYSVGPLAHFLSHLIFILKSGVHLLES